MPNFPPISAVSTEADAGERVGVFEGESQIHRGTAAGEPEKGDTNTSKTEGKRQ